MFTHLLYPCTFLDDCFAMGSSRASLPGSFPHLPLYPCLYTVYSAQIWQGGSSSKAHTEHKAPESSSSTKIKEWERRQKLRWEGSQGTWAACFSPLSLFDIVHVYGAVSQRGCRSETLCRPGSLLSPLHRFQDHTRALRPLQGVFTH